MTVRVLHGDCRDVLRTLPDASVQCCVTDYDYENNVGSSQTEGAV